MHFYNVGSVVVKLDLFGQHVFDPLLSNFQQKVGQLATKYNINTIVVESSLTKLYWMQLWTSLCKMLILILICGISELKS